MEKSDFYKVLGLRRNCSSLDVRSAYKKLAMIWHPDKCSEGRTAAASDQAKRRFQAIQEAYAVLSDEGQRFWYDARLYDQEEEDLPEVTYGMKDFMEEMAMLLSENRPKSNGVESFEELKELFIKMLDADNIMPTSKQKLDMSSSEHFNCTRIPMLNNVSPKFQTSGFSMGVCSASSCGSRKGKSGHSK